MTLLSWLGILLCLSQSALLSGMNLGLFSLSRLELKVAANRGDERAARILQARRQANFTLVTILWANVGVNVVLALLSGSLLSGLAAFFFSTVVITIFAEIIPQAAFTRHTLRLAAPLLPLLRFYQILLYPVARPTAWALDAWLGGEEMRFFPEQDMRRLIRLHMEVAGNEIDMVEGQGALNFLELDDVPLDDEGEAIDPDSILQLEFTDGRPVFPAIEPAAADSFLQAVNQSGKSWVVIVDERGEPRLVLNANEFIRDAIFTPAGFNPYRYCHRPIISRRSQTRLGDLIQRYHVRSGGIGEDIVEDDVILLWGDRPRIVTGTDILGRLLRGIAEKPKSAAV
jgi:metal transporter CNNM